MSKITHISKMQDTQAPVYDKHGNISHYKPVRKTFCNRDTAKENRLITQRFYEVEKKAGRDKNPNLPICPDCVKAMKNG